MVKAVRDAQFWTEVFEHTKRLREAERKAGLTQDGQYTLPIRTMGAEELMPSSDEVAEDKMLEEGEETASCSVSGLETHKEVKVIITDSSSYGRRRVNKG